MKNLVVSFVLMVCSSVHAAWTLLNKDSEVANYYESTITKLVTL
jgi:hypothetical protein